jgi:sugar phosphate isomerase/epimerase
MKLSLAGWSLQTLFNAKPNPLKLTEFAPLAKNRFGIDAIELNNVFFESTLPSYLDQLLAIASGAGVKMLNIAVDEEGDLANENARARAIAVANYARWIPIARYLGCSSIRANSGGHHVKDHESAVAACIDSFKQLAAIGKKQGIPIVIENHWGLSFDPDFIVKLVKAVRQEHGDESMGVLADFGNWPDEVDRYAALEKIMPFAFATHAKVNDIDEALNHPRFDHARCVAIARAAGFDGYLGIEYEGSGEPMAGIERSVRKLKSLL